MDEQLNVNEVLNAWDVVRQVNYRPIFDVAYRLTEEVLATDDGLVGRVLQILRDTAQGLIARGLEQVHELAGIVFQRLIVDPEVHQGELYTPRIRCTALCPRFT